jgi:hypothetical protein
MTKYRFKKDAEKSWMIDSDKAIINMSKINEIIFDTELNCKSTHNSIGHFDAIDLGTDFGGEWSLKFFDVVPEETPKNDWRKEPMVYPGKPNTTLLKVGKLKEEQSDFYDQLQKSVLEVTSDVVNKPSHYQFGNYEPVKVIQDWNLSFCLGNTLKYIARAGKKDPLKKKEDLLKAKRYIELELESME